MKRSIYIFFKIQICIFLVGFCSCNYRPLNPKDSQQRIYIKVSNESFAPQFGFLLRRVLDEELLKRGNLNLVDSSVQSDIIIDLKITNFSKSLGISFDDDPLIARTLVNKIFIHIIVTKKQPKFHSYKKSLEAVAPSFRNLKNNKANYDKAFLEIAEEFARQIKFLLISDLP